MGTTVLYMDTPEQHARRVAEVVKRALEAAQIPQREASARTGIPMTTLVRRLGGSSPFKANELAALSGLIGCTVSSIFEAAERGVEAGAA